MQLHFRPVAGCLALVFWLSSPAHALDEDDLENLSRHGEASAEALVKFGNVGETLTHISSSKFGGMGLTGSQRRDMSRRADAAMAPWRNASATAKGSLSYKVLPHAFTLADEGMAMLGSFAEGDLRGVTSTAVSVAVEPVAIGAFTAIGTGAGAVVGSFVPVLGNALGGMVGGAIGTVAGGYISSYAYDKYVKDMVIRAAEGGFAAVFDTSPLQQAMQARQAFLHQNASPEVKAEWDRMNAVSRSFGGGEGQVLDWERLPYIIQHKPPLPPPSAAAPAPEQQTALPPSVGALLPDNLQILGGMTPDNCSIANGQMRCEMSWSLGNSQWHKQFTGTVSGSTVTGTAVTIEDVRFKAVACAYRWRWTYQIRYDFEDGGRMHVTASNGAISLVANSCPVPPKAHLPPGYSGDGNWVARQ